MGKCHSQLKQSRTTVPKSIFIGSSALPVGYSVFCCVSPLHCTQYSFHYVLFLFSISKKWNIGSTVFSLSSFCFMWYEDWWVQLSTTWVPRSCDHFWSGKDLGLGKSITLVRMAVARVQSELMSRIWFKDSSLASVFRSHCWSLENVRQSLFSGRSVWYICFSPTCDTSGSEKFQFWTT